MPYYSWLPLFMQEYQRLSTTQQQAFLKAVQHYIVEPLKAGNQPQSHIFHKMCGYNVYEFRWDQCGRFRATCTLFVNASGEVELEWTDIISKQRMQMKYTA